MDNRVIFALVFLFTAFATILVFVVSLLRGESWMHVGLYTITTMWIIGICSQLLFKHLFLSIVKPMEDKKVMTRLSEEANKEIDVESIEVIDQVVDGGPPMRARDSDKENPTPISS